jgi:hypothetical protein
VPASAGGSSKVRQACRPRQDTAFDERRQDGGARARRSSSPIAPVMYNSVARAVPFAFAIVVTRKPFGCPLLSGVFQGLAR